MQMIWHTTSHIITALIHYAILIVKIIYINLIVHMEWLAHRQLVILEEEIGYNATFKKGSAKIPLLKKVEQNSTFEKSGAKFHF